MRLASTSVDSITFHQGQKSRTKLARDFIIYESEDGEASVTLQSVATKLLSSEQRRAPSKTNLPPVYAFLTGQDRDTPEAQRPPQQSQKIICAVKFVPVTADRADSLTKN